MAALVAGVGGYALSNMQAPVYEAESRMVLAVVQDFDPLGRQSFADSSRFVANQVSVVSSQPVIDAAVRTLDDGTTSEELLDAVDVSASADADVLEVATTGPTAEAAANRADALVEGYRAYVRDRVDAKAADVVRATSDQAVINSIETQAASYGDGLAVVDTAEAPRSPSGPVPVRDGAVLAVLAALVAAGVGLLRRRPASANATAPEKGGVAVLGTVPTEWRDVQAGDAGVREEFSLPLVSLSYVIPASASPIVITGVSERSGSAEVVHGLALVAAAHGKRVLAVDAEPQERELSAMLGASPPRSLGELGRKGTEAQVLARMPVTGILDLAAVGSVGAVTLSDSDSVATALRRLRTSYDLIFVHVAPVTSDALAFSMLHHASYVVAAMGAKEDEDLVTATRDRLSLAQVPLAGILVTTSKRHWRRRVAAVPRQEVPAERPAETTVDAQPEVTVMPEVRGAVR